MIRCLPPIYAGDITVPEPMLRAGIVNIIMRYKVESYRVTVCPPRSAQLVHYQGRPYGGGGGVAG